MIQTARLNLIPLTNTQLAQALESIPILSKEIHVLLVSSLVTGNAERAVKMKIGKMGNVPEELHPWFTYWLIVIRKENVGAGLVGFKGSPNDKGEVEIGYGIDPLYQGCGYMTEAVRAMVDWAFSHLECKAVTATGVSLDNHSSQKVLLHAGFTETISDAYGISYKRNRV